MNNNKIIKNSLTQLYGLHIIEHLLSYKMEIEELFDYLTMLKPICECSYELQCAIFDCDDTLYEDLTNQYFIDKVRESRVDKDFKFLYIKG